MNRPKFLANVKLTDNYYKAQNPYEVAPSCNINLVELSRYARKQGKALSELSEEEIKQFLIA
jgi:hypothetical protein